MGTMTSAYKREIDGRDGWTHDITVELEAVRLDEEIVLSVGNVGNASTAHLDLEHARQLRESLDEAIMLLETAQEW